MLNKKIYILGTASLLLLSTMQVFAQETDKPKNQMIRNEFRKEVKEARQENGGPLTDEQRQEIKTEVKEQITAKKNDIRKNNSYKEIDRRVEALKKLISRISEIKKLTDTQKSELTNEINAQITSLTNLKSQIESETDTAKIAELKKKIVESYRIYALFIPKIEILANADKILATTEKLELLIKSAEVKLAEQKAAGKDISAIETKINGSKEAVAKAKTYVQGAIDKVIGLTPSNYTGDKTPLNEARKLLESARKELNNSLNSVKAGRAMQPKEKKINQSETNN